MIDTASLLATRCGYAAAVTGGLNGPVVTVTNNNDSGPGSLRQAVAGDAPKWVVVSGALTIRPARPIAVGSNTTLDGRYGSIELVSQGLTLWNVSNIIISNIKITNAAVDGIQMAYAADLIWIDQCTVQGSSDGNIDRTHTGVGPSRITISRCRLTGAHKCCLFGLAAGKGYAETGIRATFYKTWFQNDERNPKILQGVAQIANCVIQYRDYGIGSFDGAHVLVDRCIFVPTGSPPGPAALTNGYNGIGKATGYNLTDGNLKASGNLMMGGPDIIENNPALAGRITFPHLALNTPTAALRTTITQGAGVRPALVLA